jgi:hypothetical protein
MKRVNDIKRGPIANCIVLHDFKNNNLDLKFDVRLNTNGHIESLMPQDRNY